MNEPKTTISASKRAAILINVIVVFVEEGRLHVNKIRKKLLRLDFANMAADITQLFKASVKTVRTRNKALGVGKENAKSNILNHGKHKTDFAVKSRDVVGE